MVDRAHTPFTVSRCRLHSGRTCRAILVVLTACCGCVVVPQGWTPTDGELDDILCAPHRHGPCIRGQGYGVAQCDDVCVDGCSDGCYLAEPYGDGLDFA